MYLFIFRLLFCLATKTYLPPQLLVDMPIDLPVHYPTCSFWLLHSDKPFVLTCPLTCCSNYSQIYPFINQPVPFVCVFRLVLDAHLSANLSAGLRTDRPTRKLMYLLILMHEDLCVHTPADEWKGKCACYAENEEINWTGILMNSCICVHVEQQKRWRVDLNG